MRYEFNWGMAGTGFIATFVFACICIASGVRKYRKGDKEDSLLFLTCGLLFMATVVYIEFLGHPRSEWYEYENPGNWEGFRVKFIHSKSPALDREISRIIVFDEDWGTTLHGARRAGVAKQDIHGRGRIFLRYADGTVSETKSPLFEELWKHRGNLLAHAQEAVGPKTSFSETLKAYIRTLKPDEWDEPLKTFFKEDKHPEKKD